MLENLSSFFPTIIFIAQGSIITLKYSIISVLCGLVIGTLLAICKVSNKKIFRLFANFYTSIFRGTPLLIQLSIIYFGLPGLIGLKLSIFFAGIIAFSLNSGAYVSEIIRAGINTVDKGQFEAAEALGISRVLIMKDIILPQAIRNIFPSLINELINLIKESAIISLVGNEMDLMRRANIVSHETYNYFPPMLIAGMCYYLIIIIINGCAKIIEKKLAIS